MIYSLGQRCYYAFALWPTHTPVRVHSYDPDELVTLMREAESAHIMQATPWML
ncbi:hypothetical protein [Bailinhaonella thermotolerans]|uniref:hypothetical protein n=1 Tax=Bailinhaonella thermotolerans TaxID=1070861 RepID=UPI00192A6B48|nr:hypothetical protein [Bailinhaonella thermotolerans]